MHKKPRLRGRLLMGWLGAVLLLGCAALPNAPSETLPLGVYVSSPQWAQAGGASGRGGVQLTDLGGTIQPFTKEIDGSTGGQVKIGRFMIDVPSGAFNGMAEISITVPDSNVLRVKLHLTGVPNKFYEPVKLVISWDDALGSLEANPSALEIVWFDETAGRWVVIPSQVDLTEKTIWTELDHFSDYGVIEAKAGW